ncbi:MAG: HAD hydrolase-like protein [Candidatus Hodarchaeota archaeon]
MSFAIFFDDGGVLNDNSIRAPQWRVFCGEFFHSRFGGDPEVWGKANQRVMMSLEIHGMDPKEIYDDYITYYTNFKSEWVIKMFEEAKRSIPPKIEHERIFDTATEYIWSKVYSAIPGIIESIKILYSKGFILYTSTGLPSREIKMVLKGMGIKQFFSGFYGPDLINTRKLSSNFYEAIFNDINLESKNAIVIEDQPRFIENALKTGANVIQTCITGEFQPKYPFYVENMHQLPKVIENLIRTLD